MGTPGPGGAAPYFNSLMVLLIYTVWDSLPFKILILLSALQSIDKQYYQAAQIDGTSKARTLWRITVPLLSPQILYLMITSFIGAFKSYNSVIAIFGDQAKPYGATTNTMATVVWSIYNSIGAQQQGVASAGAVVLFIIIMIITAIQSAVSKKRVHY
jgi:multiple sugar transport system permease protein